MERLIESYTHNPWQIAHHVLLLAAFIYACVTIGKHAGPSLCVVFSALLNIVAFVSQIILYEVLDIRYGTTAGTVFGHLVSALWFGSVVLLYVGVFGWRSKAKRMGWENVTMDANAPAYAAPQMPITPVYIPVGWAWTLTILSILWTIFSLVTAGVFIAILASDGDEDTAMGALVALGLASAVFVIFDVVLTLMILHRGWQAIQDGHARTTPGRAVGYLFIPFYSLYWIFVAWAGFAKDFNAFLSRHGIPTRRVSEGLFTTQCILMLVGIIMNQIPVIGMLYSLIVMIMGLVMLWSITKAVNEVHAHLVNAQDGFPPAAVGPYSPTM